MDDHSITHRYDTFADQYARLGFTDTYYLGFRDVPRLLKKFKINVGDALDHGCGGGRATRFLKQLGFNVIGVDRNGSMLSQARAADPSGEYRLLPDGSLDEINDHSFDLIFQSSVSEEYSTINAIIQTFKDFHRLLRPDGKIIIVTASEELPTGDWASFSYPDRQRTPRSGEQVRCVVRGSDIVFNDYFWTDINLHSAFASAGFEVKLLHQPLAAGDEPYQWRDELHRPAWSIYVLQKRT